MQKRFLTFTAVTCLSAVLFVVAPAVAQEDPLPPPRIDDVTRGWWKDLYGECGYTLGAYDAARGCEIPILEGEGQCELPTCDPATLTPQCPGSYQGGASQDILDCESSFDLNGDSVDDWRYRVYAGPNFGSSRILMNPDGTCSGANGVWFNPRSDQCPGGGLDNLSYDVTGIPAGQYRMAVYLMDWDGNNTRAESIEVCIGAVCSTPAAVGSYSSGVYVKFDVDVAAGESITVTHVVTGGWFALVQGVFFDPGTPLCANGKACYVGLGTEDRLSRGNWLWSYGSQGYIMFNHDRPNMRKPPSGCLAPGSGSPTTVIGGFPAGATPGVVANTAIAEWYWTNSPPDPACGIAMAWIWNCDDSSGRGLENPGRCGGVGNCTGGFTSASTWDDAGERQAGGPDLFVDVEVDLPGVYELSVYAVDYDSFVRKQRYHLYEYHSYNPIAPVVDIGAFRDGKYVTWTLAAPFKVTLRAEYYEGANSVISGVFVDPAPGYLCEGEPTGDDCDDEPGDYCTYTIGGWGAPYAGANPGTIRDDNWNTVYPPVLFGDSDGDGYGDLVIGSSAAGCRTLTYTGPMAVEAYLPCGGPPRQLQKDLVDPACGKGSSPTKNVLASQVTSVRLNVDYSCAGVLPAEYGDDPGELCLGDLVITQGPFIGLTVNEFLVLAEEALSCGVTNPDLVIDDFNWAATGINENFAGCDVSNGFLECPPNGGGGGCNVFITKDVGPDQDVNGDELGPDAAPGDRLTFTLNVEAGNEDLTNVTVTDVLPTFELGGVTFDYYVFDWESVVFVPSAGQTWGYDDATNTLTFHVGELAAGNKVTITYEVEVHLMAPIGSSATNTSTVTASTDTDGCAAEADKTVYIIPGPLDGAVTNDIGTPGFWCDRLDPDFGGGPFDDALIEMWLADISVSSRLDTLDRAKALKWTCAKPDAGNNGQKLGRQLVTIWLNVASTNIWTDIALEQLCLGPVPFPAGTDLKWTVGEVITYAEQSILDSDTGAFLFWKDVLDAINSADSPVDACDPVNQPLCSSDGDGWNGLQLDPITPFDPRFDGNACDPDPGDPCIPDPGSPAC